MSGRYDRPLTPEQIAEVKDEDIDFPPSVALSGQPNRRIADDGASCNLAPKYIAPHVKGDATMPLHRPAPLVNKVTR